MYYLHNTMMSYLVIWSISTKKIKLFMYHHYNQIFYHLYFVTIPFSLMYYLARLIALWQPPLDNIHAFFRGLLFFSQWTYSWSFYAWIDLQSFFLACIFSMWIFMYILDVNMYILKRICKKKGRKKWNSKMHLQRVFQNNILKIQTLNRWVCIPTS